MMDVITQRRCLTVVAGGLLVGTVAAIGWAFSSLPDPPAAARTSSPQRVSAAPIEGAEQSEPDRDAQWLSVALRRPLVDPPPPPPPRPTPSRPPVVREKPERKPMAAPRLEFTLLGTIIDSQRRLAIIADPTGSFDIKGVGDALDLSPAGVAIERIESDQVTLAFEGKQATVRVDKTRKPGSFRPANNRGRVR